MTDAAVSPPAPNADAAPPAPGAQAAEPRPAAAGPAPSPPGGAPLAGDVSRPTRGASRDAATWARIRDAYASGHAAWRVAKTYGVGESTLRTRARLEGWRRCDLARHADARLAAEDAPPPGCDPCAPFGSPHDPADYAATAVRRAAEEARFGRLDEAERWARVAERLAAAERALAALAAARPEDLADDDALDAARERLTARLEKLVAGG